MGIKDAYYTVRVKDRSGSEQHVIANVNMYVTLPRNLRARTCRVEVPHQHEREISVESFRDILEELTKRAYDNPKFVEDIVCDVAARLNSEDHVALLHRRDGEFRVHSKSLCVCVDREG